MRYKLLGKSGLRVSEVALGALTFGEETGWGAPKEESRKVFNAYVEAGGNFIDTAISYTDGTSEKWVGEFIAAKRSHFVVATKYTMSKGQEEPNHSGNHRKNMMHSLETSLKRLNTDFIDLYWVHAWDFMTPVEEVMRALDDAVRAGKILYVGISNAPAWVVSQANTLSELKSWSAFVGLQIQYSLMNRTPERELLPMARAFDIGVTAWGALGSGILTGKYNKNASVSGRAAIEKRLNERGLGIAKELVALSEEIGHTPSQIALNWVRQQPGVMIPLIGARTLKQFQDNIGCLEFTLTEKHMQRLHEVSKIEMGYPHEFLAQENVIKYVYGGVFSRIDNHRR